MRRINFDTDYYRRHLPHLQRAGANYFVTTRLVDSIPKEQLNQLQAEQVKLKRGLSRTDLPLDEKTRIENELKRHFAKYDALLDKASTGPSWLRDPSIAKLVFDHILTEAERSYRLDCFTIMSNHIHIVLKPNIDVRLDEAMRRIKQPTAFHCNKRLARHGAFWQDGSYDHIIREREWARIIWYVLQNPVEAGLVTRWQDWPYTYLSPNILGFE